MADVSYEEGKKQAYRGFVLLGIITVIEVLIALVGNGHIIEGFTITKWIMYPLMIAFSLYKAYFIVNEFMHMRYEARGLAMTVVLPMGLLFWAIYAFLSEGNYWGERRQQIKEFNEFDANESKSSSSILKYEEIESGLKFS